MASFLVLILKFLKGLDFSFFVGDIISGIGLGLFGRGHQALGPNCKNQFFDSILTNFLTQLFDSSGK